MGGTGTFVYILEEDAVSALLPGWPADMQVAVCLSPDGACDLAVHYRDEVSHLLARLASANGLSRNEICVTPRVDGYPTRKVMFSEEQQLLSIVAENQHLAEMASDYAINYRFALDEGLDSDAVTGARAPVEIRADQASLHADKKDHAPIETEHHLHGKRTHNFVTHLSLPSGYAAPAAAQRSECMFVEARLQLDGDLLRLTVAPQHVDGTETGVRVARVGCRDDFARFVLPRNALDGWSLGRAAILELPASLFPEALIARYADTARNCELTVTARGVFVSPGAPCNAVEQRQMPIQVSKKPKRRIFRPVHGAVAALVAGMVLTGHLATALDQSALQPVAGAPSDGATAALDLIAAMARESASQ